MVSPDWGRDRVQVVFALTEVVGVAAFPYCVEFRRELRSLRDRPLRV